MKKNTAVKGFPVNLFLEGKSCLVVGGGKVALHKIELLLEAGAQVSVVSPETCPEVAAMIAGGRIAHAMRPFEEQDVEGAAIIYAATSHRPVNRAVLDACRARNIFCCCVDGNWADSDFSTPAITRQGPLAVAVSSGGNDCRQSKMVKNSLARHLRMMGSATLVVVGTDHNHLTVEEREPFHLTGPRFERAGFMIMQLWGIHEFMVLNTCNRVEVVAVVSEETARNGILRHILGFTHLKEDKFYLKSGRAAFEHLCLVAAGMYSQTPGENHIAAQVKEALAEAKARGWAGSLMQEWVSSAQHVSKRIRNAAAPLLRGIEIEDLVLKYLDASGRDLANATLMVLGSGMVGRGLVRDGLGRIGRIVWCYHSNKPELPADANGRIELCSFNDIKDRIGQADIIISATEAPGHLLHLGHAPFFNQEKPVLMIDLGMPRNIDPELENLSPDITVLDLDDLKYWFRNELADMDAILGRSRAIVGEHLDLYEKIIRSFQGGNAAE